MSIQQPTLFELPTPTATPPRQAESRQMKNIQIASSLSDALKCAAGLVLIDTGWPTFDRNDQKFYDPESPAYIEAERLPEKWLELVGVTVCADRITVGTIADLLEVLPADVANEWRELYAKSEEDDSALLAFEEAHRIRWYGEGYYLDADEGEGESDD